MKMNGNIATASDKLLIVDCVKSFTSSAFFKDYIIAVKAQAQKRRLQALCSELAYDEHMGNVEMLNALKNSLEREEVLTDTSTYEQQGVMQVMGYLKAKQDITEGKLPPRIKTGIPVIDNYIGGLQIPSVSCVGALPSTGKTDLMIQTAVNECFQGKKAILFSLEMSTNQVLDRIAAQITSIDYSKISDNKIDKEDWDIISTGINRLYNNGFLIFDSTNTIEAMEQIVSEISPGFVGIDYLQIVDTQKRYPEKRHQIDYIGQVCKRMAKQNNCHCMMISQLARTQGMPTMQSLKESGSIEQQSDCIMLVHRPYVLDKENASPEETKLIVAKNKFGKTVIANLAFKGERQKFYEISNR